LRFGRLSHFRSGDRQDITVVGRNRGQVLEVASKGAGMLFGACLPGVLAIVLQRLVLVLRSGSSCA
jgi:hypothetical protein